MKILLFVLITLFFFVLGRLPMYFVYSRADRPEFFNLIECSLYKSIGLLILAHQAETEAHIYPTLFLRKKVEQAIADGLIFEDEGS